jgi:catechol 2,3-dioxygenase
VSVIAPNIELGLVRLTVRDAGRARAFYESGLGFECTESPGGRLSLSVPGGAPLIEIKSNRQAHPSDPELPGLQHLGLVVPTRRDLAVVLFRLGVQGIGLKTSADHLVSEAIYVEDVERTVVGITRDRHPSQWPRDDHGRPSVATLALDLRDLANEIAGELPLSEPATRLPAGTRIGHVHLRVADMRRAEAFYAGVLGFEVTVRDPSGTLLLAAGAYHHHIGLTLLKGRRDRRAPPDSAGFNSFELRFPTHAALAEVIDRVVADEMPLEQTDRGALVNDPSGNAVLLTS